MKKFQTILMISMFSILLIACNKDNDEQAEPIPEANFLQDRNYVEKGELVTFTNTSTNAVEYEWNFGNGESSTLSNPTISYEESGNYTVKLIAFNSDGLSNMFTSNVVVGNRYLREIKVNEITWYDSQGTLWDGGLFGDNTGPDIMFEYGSTYDSYNTTTIYDVTESQINAGDIFWQINPGLVQLTDAVWGYTLIDVDQSNNEVMAYWEFNPVNTGIKNYQDGTGSFTLAGNQNVTYEIVWYFQIIP